MREGEVERERERETVRLFHVFRHTVERRHLLEG